jgi:hypothetical protein
MKAVILAGGLGTRISEETNLKPKPMVEIGGQNRWSPDPLARDENLFRPWRKGFHYLCRLQRVCDQRTLGVGQGALEDLVT